MRSSRETEWRHDLREPGAAARAAASGSYREHAPQIEALPERVHELENELAAMEDRYKRAVADLDNLRKRSAREVDRRVAQEREALLGEWLQALDSVERALRQPVAADNPLFAGLHAVLEQMETILERQGAQRIGSAGERFDPERHQAVGVRDSDQLPDRTVVEVARSGFALGDRVLRPAEVVVARRDPEGAR